MSFPEGISFCIVILYLFGKIGGGFDVFSSPLCNFSPARILPIPRTIEDPAEKDRYLRVNRLS
jgi:hypothetical protein